MREGGGWGGALGSYNDFTFGTLIGRFPNDGGG